VLFDVDGTLVDTTYLHSLAWWRSLHEAGHEAPMAVIHRLIGMNSQRLVSELLGHPDEAVIEGHSRHFGDLKAELRAFPGAGALLATVHDRGALVVLATSAKAEDVDEMVAAVGPPPDSIDHVTDSSAGGRSKPEPDTFRIALDSTGLAPERALVVGDTVWDVEAAARCGMGCVAVETGGRSAEELEDAGAIAVYPDVGGLLAEIDASPLGELLAGSDPSPTAGASARRRP
jgi:HAD superfamily hydrolase (TIGR01509 family)